jgi:S1-C subfamily serine protease
MNLKSAGRWTYNILLFLLLLGIVFQTHELFHGITSKKTSEDFQFPYNSFAYISIELSFSSSSLDFQLPENFDGVISSRGSGLVIGKTQDNNSAVLTANHVCNPPPFSSIAWTGDFEKNIMVTDFYGNTYSATVVASNIANDLCILEVNGMKISGVRLSDEQPSIGNHVYAVASPMAFFSPGMVPLLDGYYSGDVFSSRGLDSVYSVPAREGSSGASVLNKDGEIIGVIHSSISGFQHVAICSTYPEVKAFLYEFEVLLGGTLSQ